MNIREDFFISYLLGGYKDRGLISKNKQAKDEGIMLFYPHHSSTEQSFLLCDVRGQPTIILYVGDFERKKDAPAYTQVFQIPINAKWNYSKLPIPSLAAAERSMQLVCQKDWLTAVGTDNDKKLILQDMHFGKE